MSPAENADYVARRPVALAHFSMSGQFHAGRPPTVQRGSGKPSARILHASTADRETPSRAAISTVPTGSQVMPNTVGKVLTGVKVCRYNTYMTKNQPTVMIEIKGLRNRQDNIPRWFRAEHELYSQASAHVDALIEWGVPADKIRIVVR